ncbi:MAG: hypothetical protein RJQ14_00990 [Marinoscillum sp.]
MKKILQIVLVLFVFSSCVDDYQDANPPRLLDGPAIYSLTVSNDTIEQGTTSEITVYVNDAPAGVDSVSVVDLADGDPAGGSYTVTDFSGLTQGDIKITYTAPTPFAGNVEITVQVFDAQTDQDGELVRKSSLAKTTTINVFCNESTADYTVDGDILVDDFGSGPYSETETLTIVTCVYQYEVADITGGLYSQGYADGYGTSGRAATLVHNPENDRITWSGVSDQFGGEIVQDPAQPISNMDANGVITVYWTATAYGERGITTYTPN